MEEKSVPMEEVNVSEAYKEPIPYFVYERTMARFERTIKRLIIVIGIAVALIFASNMAWLWVFNSYNVVSEEVSLDGKDGGNANYIGASGVINNGEGSSKEDSTAKEK